jgi:membrane protein DedA with SNARE-associated domain
VTDTLLDLAGRFGYLAVFLGVGIESMGVPIPGETILLIGAVLAGRGTLNPWLVGLAGWLGAVGGDNLGYLIGRRWGTRLVTVPLIRRVYRPEHLERAERFFARHGWSAVFFGRFIALLRILAGPLAGMHRMPWRHFVIANAAGGACWVAVVVIIGLAIGTNLERALSLVADMGYAGLGLAAVLVIGAVVWKLFRRRR